METHVQFDTVRQVLTLLDQRLLPGQQAYVTCVTVQDVVVALQDMVVRGAPAIGVSAAWGCVLAVGEVCRSENATSPQWAVALEASLEALANARPTAVNLQWAVKRMYSVWKNTHVHTPEELLSLWLDEAAKVHAEDIRINKQLGMHGSKLLESGDTVMTHCNAGALATAGYGTALGVIYAAQAAGKNIPGHCQ